MKLRLEDTENKVIVYNQRDYSQILNSHIFYCVPPGFQPIVQSNSKIVIECCDCKFKIEYHLDGS